MCRKIGEKLAAYRKTTDADYDQTETETETVTETETSKANEGAVKVSNWRRTGGELDEQGEKEQTKTNKTKKTTNTPQNLLLQNFAKVENLQRNFNLGSICFYAICLTPSIPNRKGERDRERDREREREREGERNENSRKQFERGQKQTLWSILNINQEKNINLIDF